MKCLRIATQNAHKLREFREMLEPLGYTVLGTEGLDGFAVVEDGATFAANALKKAAALTALTNDAAIADDSGLVVDALDGAPGVHSARYSGDDTPDRDAANRRKLLAALADVADERRTARFVCALAYVTPGGAEPLIVEGRCEGMIGRLEQGDGGFGYDSLFVVPAHGRTLAQLSPTEKNALSHRGRALRAFLVALRFAGGRQP